MYRMATDELTRNWQKANSGRKFFHEGIVDFTCDIITDIYDRFVERKSDCIETDNVIYTRQPKIDPVVTGNVHYPGLQCDRGINKQCLCKDEGCQSNYDKVIDLHVCSSHTRLQNWHRCFCHDKLSVAACFLTLHEPHEQKNTHLDKLEDVDSLGLLTILDNCSLESEKYIKRDLIQKAIGIHKKITRNPKNETEKDTLYDFLDVLSHILRSLDKTKYPKVTVAITRLVELKTDDSSIGEYAIELTPGKLYDPTKELGRGRFAVVYKGMSGSGEAMFPAAVKQILYRDEDKSLVKELSEAKIMQLLETKRHPHVVGYYELYCNPTHLYIFTELYDGTLEDYVKESHKCLRENFDATQVNLCLAKGLQFLHHEGVVHRDLKPSNVFIHVDGQYIDKVAIGDFGQAKLCRMKFEYSASLSYAAAPGTAGYVAPEVWDWYENDPEEDEKKYFTVKSDTFSLGLIFYFTLSTGKHPFGTGSGFRIQQRIQNNETPNLSDAGYEYRCLISRMIKIDIRERMFAECVMDHPALWTSEQVLCYFKCKSNYLKDCNQPVVNQIQAQLESRSRKLIDTCGWIAKLPDMLKARLSSGPHSFEGKEYSVLALLRAIRNVEHHIDNYPELSADPDGRVAIWRSTCPGLLMCVYEIFQEYQ